MLGAGFSGMEAAVDKERLLYAGEFLVHLLEPLTAEDIAASAAMSLRSLQRHFADSVGESLWPVMSGGRRLTQAAQQLVQGIRIFSVWPSIASLVVMRPLPAPFAVTTL